MVVSPVKGARRLFVLGTVIVFTLAALGWAIAAKVRHGPDRTVDATTTSGPAPAMPGAAPRRPVHLAWSREWPEYSGAALLGGRIVADRGYTVLAEDHGVRVLNSRTGSERWRYVDSGRDAGAPQVGGGRVAVEFQDAHHSARTRVFDLRSGRIATSVSGGRGSAAVSVLGLYPGTVLESAGERGEREVRAVDPATGRTRWRHPVGCPEGGSPAPVSGGPSAPETWRVFPYPSGPVVVTTCGEIPRPGSFSSVVGLDTRTGSQRWSNRIGLGEVRCPSWEQGSTCHQSWQDGSRPLLFSQLDPGTSDELGTLVDPATGRLSVADRRSVASADATARPRQWLVSDGLCRQREGENTLRCTVVGGRSWTYDLPGDGDQRVADVLSSDGRAVVVTCPVLAGQSDPCRTATLDTASGEPAGAAVVLPGLADDPLAATPMSPLSYGPDGLFVISRERSDEHDRLLVFR